MLTCGVVGGGGGGGGAMAMEVEKYNKKNTAVKRILQEVKEMQSNPSDDFMALPLEVIDRKP